jgi:hypothetical protein
VLPIKKPSFARKLRQEKKNARELFSNQARMLGPIGRRIGDRDKQMVTSPSDRIQHSRRPVLNSYKQFSA